MTLFSHLYTRVMRWSAHRHATYYLFGLSFAEASFFPLPPDVMLAPMTLGKPHNAWRYALLSTLGSVLGGLLGYVIGYFAFELVQPLLHRVGYWERYLEVHHWFNTWGFWAVFLAGVSPIPYKLFTITAGVVSMALAPFILASAIGRGVRFFLVAGLMRWGGTRMDEMLRRYIERIGWAVVLAALVLYLILRS